MLEDLYKLLLQLGALSVAMIVGFFILGISVTLSERLLVYLLGLL